jgi:putative spermidine/putrescine transport system ATP-binding protein
VERVIPRGHFFELVLRREDATLHGYFTGRPPAVGDHGFVRVTEWLIFRDGELAEHVR